LAGSIAGELETHRNYLLRVALLQLRDRDLAEDVVQETMIAALQGAADFSGRSTVKTWLTGILKHKIIDAIRRRSRERPISSLEDEADIDDFDALFNQRGAWDAPPAEWGDPTRSLEQRQFFEVLEICMDRLPPNTARVFMMRELLELTSDEICKELSITSTNLWVILYRARMSLRKCLEDEWFAGSGNRA